MLKHILKEFKPESFPVSLWQFLNMNPKDKVQDRN